MTEPEQPSDWPTPEEFAAFDAALASCRGPEPPSDSERLPPAINPEGAEVDHDCVFRRMVRDLAHMVGVQPAEGGLYRAEDIEDAITALLAGTGPSNPAGPGDQ